MEDDPAPLRRFQRKWTAALQTITVLPCGALDFATLHLFRRKLPWASTVLPFRTLNGDDHTVTMPPFDSMPPATAGTDETWLFAARALSLSLASLPDEWFLASWVVLFQPTVTVTARVVSSSTRDAGAPVRVDLATVCRGQGKTAIVPTTVAYAKAKIASALKIPGGAAAGVDIRIRVGDPAAKSAKDRNATLPDAGIVEGAEIWVEQTENVSCSLS